MFFLGEDEKILWKGKPRFGIGLLVSTLLAVMFVTLGVYLINAWNPTIGFMVMLLAAFPALPLIPYVTGRSARYFVTDLRVVRVREDFVRQLSFDNIDTVSAVPGFTNTSVYVSAADESDLDSVFDDGKTAYFTMHLEFLNSQEAEFVSKLLRTKIVPRKEPRVYRCGGGDAEFGTKDELIEHILIQHHGSVS
jgi:uncharacterized membrane protein YjgN (DUF898 family)